MTENSAHRVWLNETEVGYLLHRDNVTEFRFDDTYLTLRERPVLGLRFEENLRTRVVSNLRLPVWFSNLLPEGVLREWIADERGVSPAREMELLAQVGRDLPGAIRVLPLDEAPAAGRDGAQHGEEDGSKSLLGPSLGGPTWRFSLAGVSLKFSMLRANDRFTCPAHGAGGDWIVKLPDRNFAGVPENEFCMMELARLVGIDVPETALVHRDEIEGLPESVWPNSEEHAFAVRRFDRTPQGHRIHIEDFAQVRGFYPEDKYYGNFETVASLAYRGRDSRSLVEFVQRMTLNILINNGDAHLKNWSLIYPDSRTPTLSPAYDILTTRPYLPKEEPEEIGLRFGGSRRATDIRLHMFTRLARLLSCNEDLAEVADNVITRTGDQWPSVREVLRSHPSLADHVDTSIAARTWSLRA